MVVGERMMVKVAGMTRIRDVQYAARPAGDLVGRGGIEKKVGWDVSDAREGTGGGLKTRYIYWGGGMVDSIFSRVFELISLEDFPRVVLEEHRKCSLAEGFPKSAKSAALLL